MSVSKVPLPQFPLPPAEYDRIYFDELIRSLTQIVTQIQNPGELRGTTITLTDLPTSPTGLETGALYNDSGTVKVVT
tara:strand:+ start:2222 stop:2452 length:231 start_codon:yes stop_codon:yes gene_type:complete